MFAEIGKGRKIACLVDLFFRAKRTMQRKILAGRKEEKEEGYVKRVVSYLVYVGLFFCKVKFVETLIFDLQEEVVAEQVFDEGVFERLAGRVRAGESADVVPVEQIGCET